MGSNNLVTWRDFIRVGVDIFLCTKRKRKKTRNGVTWLDPKLVCFAEMEAVRVSIRDLV